MRDAVCVGVGDSELDGVTEGSDVAVAVADGVGVAVVVGEGVGVH